MVKYLHLIENSIKFYNYYFCSSLEWYEFKNEKMCRVSAIKYIIRLLNHSYITNQNQNNNEKQR
jgi:hypothetical protein